MSHNPTHKKNWWKLHWKWVLPVAGLIALLISTYFTSGLSKIGTDFAQAYTDTELYDEALKKVNSHPKITNLLGKLEPLDKLAILEGEVHYTNNNLNVTSSVRISGDKGKAMMDIKAYKHKGEWNLTKIEVRIKTPPEKKQHLDIYRSPVTQCQ
jgi:hypothetical protein